MRSESDTSGLTYLVREGKNGPSVMDYFYSPPNNYKIRGGNLDFIWMFGEKETGLAYTVVARLNCDGVPYRPTMVKVRPLRKNELVRYCQVGGMPGIIQKVHSDSVKQNGKSCDLSRYIYSSQCPATSVSILKPMIYLYPDSAMPVDVRIGPVSSLAMAYPKDDSGMWQVQAYPDGRLVERKTGKEFYGLYWEGKNWTPPSSDTGVVVRGSEFPRALDSLLELKGLNYRERQECVTFWMHSLVNSPWVMIQFFDQEFAKAHPLDISPAPTTLLRVALSFRKLTEPVSLHPPVLVKPLRRGFTVVEWGGQIKGEK